MNKTFAFIATLMFLASCQENPVAKQTSMEQLFQSISPDSSGVYFENRLQPTDSLNILEYLYFYNGGGVAVIDIDNDGLQDLYFTANQGPNKLYRNLGKLKFQDITEKAGVSGFSQWQNGIAVGDVNNDGLSDFYISAVTGIHGLEGHNELYVNNGDYTFSERSKDYGLDFQNYGTTSAFFDFDNDGDLDLYILNHAVHTRNSYGPASIQEKRDSMAGDKLLRNDNGRFTDVSEAMGIYGGINGYGLGLAVADLNMDGWMDIYVSNDFHGDEYIYLNQEGKGFRESARSLLGHTSRFSMGNDIADINHDGFPDIMTLDMLASEEAILKASDGDEDVDTYKLRTGQFGYRPQFVRNMLHMNQGGNSFSEIGLMAGVAATDWSWGALFADYNQDGEQDLFISNGIPHRPNNLDYIKYISNNDIQAQLDSGKLLNTEALKKMPSGKVQNIIYSGNSSTQFKNQSVQWLPEENTISNGAAYADLDNDGDLELITNNTDGTASILKNTQNGNYLSLQGKSGLEIGTKVYAYFNNQLHYRELSLTRGFQSSSTPVIHFGLGDHTIVDSLKLIFPNGSKIKYRSVAANQTLLFEASKEKIQEAEKAENLSLGIFRKIELPELTEKNPENRYIDFNRQKLIPFQISDRGTALTALENGNLILGGTRGTPLKILSKEEESIQSLTWAESTEAISADFNNDGIQDLLIGNGGGETARAETMYDQLLLGPDFKENIFPEYSSNTSTMVTADYDDDGDLDVFVGVHTIPGDYGKLPQSMVFRNDNGVFTKVNSFALGMVTDALWDDYDQDGDQDLLIVGEWMSPTIVENTNGKFAIQAMSSDNSGLYRSIMAYDIDDDGDNDYLLANWGLNSKYVASMQHPLRMYYGDFDNNGTTETVLAQFKNGDYYTLLGLDALAEQLNYLKKKFPSYDSFAGKNVNEVIGADRLAASEMLTVAQLASGYLRNTDGNLEFIPFENRLQLAPITAFAKADFDGDGLEDVFVGGNYFGVRPYHGRFDAFGGALISKKGSIFDSAQLGISLAQKPVTRLEILQRNAKKYLVVQINNEPLEFYTFGNENQ